MAKKLMALFLSLAVLVTLTPTIAFALEEPQEDALAAPAVEAAEAEEALGATGHAIIKTKKINSTCCSLGYKAHYECAYCHQVYKDKKGKKKSKLSKYKIKKKKHSYTKKIAAPEYLKSEATVKRPALYKKSCKWCGKAGKKTFKYGPKLAQ